MSNILIFGDSIAYGSRDTEGGWVQKLRKFFDEKSAGALTLEDLVYNLSVSGEVTDWLLERFESEIKQRIDEDEETVIIFAIGINDSCWLNKEQKPAVLPEEFKWNLQKLVDSAKKFSLKIIFLGLTPIEEAKVDPIPWDELRSYKQKYVAEFNGIIKSVCEENKVHFIEIMDKFPAPDYKTLLADGVHPNSLGHQKIFEIVRDYLTGYVF